MHNRLPSWLLALLAALLLGLSWYFHLGLLVFFGFVPLLVLSDRRSGDQPISRFYYFLLLYLSFLTWNIIVTWWITYASFGGALLAYFSNALLMSLVFLCYSFLKRKLNQTFAVWTLIPLWLAFEHIHTLWDITWTWLSLGNVFANHPNWIQWYSFTGVSGGSLWILVTNIFVYLLVVKRQPKRILSAPIITLASLILIPILCSQIMRLSSSKSKLPGVETLVIQPNFDAYTEKFRIPFYLQLEKIKRLINQKITYNTAYLVLPETFITGYSGELNEANINGADEIRWFRDSLLQKYPQLSIVTGADTYRYFVPNEQPSLTARIENRSGLYYDLFNTALYITHDSCNIYHKSKLVPGVEKMPFPAFFKFFENFAIDLGGATGSLGIQENRSVFKDRDRNVSIAPVICYESVYGNYVGDYIRNGANVIFIITNDGWWDTSPGYRQHLQLARLRAIEHRRPIARSANTGVSCFIDAYGNLSQCTNYGVDAAIIQSIQPEYELSFFSRWGDLISYAALIFAPLTLIVSAVLMRKK